MIVSLEIIERPPIVQLGRKVHAANGGLKKSETIFAIGSENTCLSCPAFLSTGWLRAAVTGGLVWPGMSWDQIQLVLSRSDGNVNSNKIKQTIKLFSVIS